MMMMGFGNYSNGGSSSSASNLSALAPPFTVERSAPKPLVDLSEPPLNWLNTQSPTSYGYSFNPSSSHMSSLSNNIPITSAGSYLYGQNSVAITTNSLAEVKPYYPASYVSPTKYTYDDYAQSLSGLWDGSRSWDFGKRGGEAGDGFCSKEMNVAGFHNYEDYIDQGYHSSKGINTSEENSQSMNMLGSDKLSGSASKEKSDYSSFLQPNSESVPVVYPREPSFCCNAGFPDTYSLASSTKQVQSLNYQLPYSSSYEKGVKEHSSGQNDSKPIIKSSPGLIIRPPPAASGFSPPNTSSFKSGQISSSGTMDVAGHNFYSRSGGKDRFDPTLVSYHLNGDNHSLKDLPWEKNEKLVTNLSVTEDPLQPEFGLQAPHMIPVGFNLNVGTNEANNILQDPDESLDQHNPPVDSPCWKGSSISHCSPNGASGANLLLRQHGSDNDLRDVSSYAKSSFNNEVQFSNVVDKPRKEFKFKPFLTLHQNLEEGNLTSGSEFVGINTNDDSDGCSYHVPLQTTEHVLSSPFSEEAAPTKVTKLDNEEFNPKKCAKTMISTIHNLSELLLFHCSGPCELDNQDTEVLKDVVNNLDKCMSKNFGPVASSYESLSSQKVPQSLAEHETPSKPQGMNSSAAKNMSQPGYHHVQQERKHYGVADKTDENFSDLVSVKGVALDRDEDEKMTQAIKKVLSENFTAEEEAHPQTLLYKNLWLEAEAALCSVKYKARFDRMKIEMEHHEPLLKTKDSSENTTQPKRPPQPTFLPNLEKSINPVPQDSCVEDIPIISTNNHPYDVMARYHILKSQEASTSCINGDVENQSSSQVCPDLNKAVEMSSEGKDSQTTDRPIWGSSFWSSTSTGDVEASVMARLQILNNRIDNSTCSSLKGQILPQAIDSDETKHWAMENGSGSPNEEKFTVKEFHLFDKDDPMIQSIRTNVLGNYQGPASNDSSSSEWEHVMKEELPAQNS